jgi:hypothetical protein
VSRKTAGGTDKHITVFAKQFYEQDKERDEEHASTAGLQASRG